MKQAERDCNTPGVWLGSDRSDAEESARGVLNWLGLCQTIATRWRELMFALAYAKRYGAMREAQG
jgi:hypothetical protein